MTDNKLDRRAFMGATTLGTGAALVGLSGAALAQAAPASSGQVDFPDDPRAFGGGPASARNRTEMTLHDCEVEGDWPAEARVMPWSRSSKSRLISSSSHVKSRW